MSKHFTIFGNPIKHSISPKMHTFAIEGLGLKANYSKTHLEDGNLIKEIFLKDFDGANVTVPHKEIAYKLCDEVRGIAKEIGAVNTLINENKKMVGYNTDAMGFFKSAKEFGTIKTVLILGAGGTARALSVIFKQNAIDITILNRSENRLTFFADKGFETLTWEQFQPKAYDLVVNTTSAGLQDNNLPAPLSIMEDIFKHARYASDAIYNKKTPFLKMSQEYGIPNKDGADMLLYQGVLAFNLFYDNKFKEDEITKYMRKAFKF